MLVSRLGLSCLLHAAWHACKARGPAHHHRRRPPSPPSGSLLYFIGPLLHLTPTAAGIHLPRRSGRRPVHLGRRERVGGVWFQREARQQQGKGLNTCLRTPTVTPCCLSCMLCLCLAPGCAFLATPLTCLPLAFHQGCLGHGETDLYRGQLLPTRVGGVLEGKQGTPGPGSAGWQWRWWSGCGGGARLHCQGFATRSGLSTLRFILSASHRLPPLAPHTSFLLQFDAWQQGPTSPSPSPPAGASTRWASPAPPPPQPGTAPGRGPPPRSSCAARCRVRWGGAARGWGGGSSRGPGTRCDMGRQAELLARGVQTLLAQLQGCTHLFAAFTAFMLPAFSAFRLLH